MISLASRFRRTSSAGHAKGGSDTAARVVRRRGDNPRALTEVERRGTERRVLEEVDRTAPLADEELRGRDVDRACGLETADGVDTAGGEMAERERERAHDAHPVGDTAQSRDDGGDRVGRRSLQREDLDGLPG